MINWNDYQNNNTAIPLFLETVGTGGGAQTISNAGVGIFVDASTSFLTTGITFTANHASRTGIHLVSIPSGTITGSNVTCTVFYTGGTVDGISVANRLAAVFTVGRYGQAPSNFSGLTINSSGFIGANVMQYNGATAPSGDFTTTMKASINTEVLDVLNVDTFAEPGQGNPPATATFSQKLGYLYKAWRNKKVQTSSQYALYNDDAVTIDQKASVTGSSTGVTVNEIATGP